MSDITITTENIKYNIETENNTAKALFACCYNGSASFNISRQLI